MLREKACRILPHGISWGFFFFGLRRLKLSFASQSNRSSRRKRPRTMQVMLLVLLLPSPSAAAQNAPPPAPTPSFTEVTDETGRKVRIPESVQRIVSLAPSLTETIYALGAEDRLVGDTDFCDFPAAARNKPKVGGAVNPSLEEIVALRPDLVLVTKSINRRETVSALERLGIPAYATDPHTVADVLSSTARLGEILRIPGAGRALALELRRRLDDLRLRLSASSPRRVLFVVWTAPLISVGQKTFIADAIRDAGGVSVVDAGEDWPQVNLEEVVKLRPEFLVFASAHSENAEREFSALAEKPGWRDLDAVRNHRLAVISEAVNRPAPRLVAAIEELARQLHPEAFSEDRGGAKENPPPVKSGPPPENRDLMEAQHETYYPSLWRCPCVR